MSVDRNKIIKFCEEYLKVKDFEDYCVNGLQVEGAENVSRIITGVTLSKKLIEAAIKRKAQMIMVHHGVGGKHFGSPLSINGYMKARLKLLLENDINLCGFHLPLDAHKIIGNNISICKLLELVNMRPCYVGFVGDFKRETLFSDFVKKINKILNVKSFTIFAGPKKIKRVGVISGAASPNFMDAVEMGADTYVSGDVRESIVRAVEENNINFINAGHYNTEKLGIQNLGKLVAKKFKVSVEFVDVPNEV